MATSEQSDATQGSLQLSANAAATQTIAENEPRQSNLVQDMYFFCLYQYDFLEFYCKQSSKMPFPEQIENKNKK